MKLYILHNLPKCIHKIDFLVFGPHQAKFDDISQHIVCVCVCDLRMRICFRFAVHSYRRCWCCCVRIAVRVVVVAGRVSDLCLLFSIDTSGPLCIGEFGVSIHRWSRPTPLTISTI